MDAFDITLLTMSAFVFVRAVMAFRWRLRMLAEVHARNVADIHGGRIETFEQIDASYEQLPSFEALLFDLARWRYVSPFEKV